MASSDVRGALAASIAIYVAATPAAAQMRTFDVPEQSATTGIPEFARQADIQILVAESAAQGQRTREVKGRMSVERGLRRLIAGTGLRIASGDGRSYTLGRELRHSEGAESGSSSESNTSSGEIVVTAQRREQRLQDVPVSVSVATGESLARNNITSLQDLSVRLPGIRLAAAPAVNLMNIRGVGSGLNAGFEQAVGTFVDGVYRGRSRASAAALFDIQRLEVLKGPQTTFFGNNVIAGALNITTRKPEFEFGINASALYAPADGEYSAELGLDIPLSDVLAVRVAGKLYGMDGYVRNESLGRDEPRNRDAVGRFSLRWRPNATWTTDLRVDVVRMRDHPAVEGDKCPGDPIYGAPAGTCRRYLISGQAVDGKFNYHANNFGGTFDYDMTEFMLTNSLEFNFATLTATTAYFEHDNQVIADVAPFPVPGLFGAPHTQTVNNEENVETYSQEIRLQSNTGRSLEYMVGGYFSHEKLDADSHVGLYFAPFGAIVGSPLSPNAHIAQRNPFYQKTENWSVFGSLTARFSQSLSLDLGVRYSSVTKKIQRDLIYGEGGSIAAAGAFDPYSTAAQAAIGTALGGEFGNFANTSHNDDKLMPSVKLSYRISPSMTAYASYTKGFKAGGYGQSVRLFELSEETVDAYEAGFKASLFGRKLFTTLAIFRSDYSGLQEATNTVLQSGLQTQILSNAARSRSQGVEFSFDAKVDARLSFHADVSYLDAKYLDYPNAPCTVLGNSLTRNCIQDMSSKRRAFAPKFSGNVGMSYVQPLPDALELRADSLVYFSSRYYQSATADPLLEQPGHAKFDLRIGFGPESGGWELAMIGKNLADKKTASFRNQFAGSPGSVWLFPERPRSIAVQASVQF